MATEKPKDFHLPYSSLLFYKHEMGIAGTDFEM